MTNEELTAEERQVIRDVFSATDRQLSEVMLPRTQVDFLRADTPLDAGAGDVLAGTHSRYPVYDENVDDIIGFVHVRDLLTALVAADPGSPIPGSGSNTGKPAEVRTVRDVVRPVTLLPGSKALLPALSQMRQSGVHLAVIVDEYGGTDGIVTLEDLIEELVGHIQDEYDLVERSPVDPAVGSQEPDGLLHRDDIQERIGVELPDGPFETLAGFIQAHLGRIPQVGDTLDVLDHRFTVLEMNGRRAARIAVAPADPRPLDSHAAG